MTQVKLGNYKGIEIPKIVVEVAAEEITSELERARQMAAEWLDVEKSENGDEVLIDFEGFLGDEAFEGGKGENYPLTLGSGSFIPGFEEQLLGMSKGDDVDVVVTFPQEYHAEDLAGKEATFKVKIHNVRRKVTPELGDEFVSKISSCETLEQFKKHVEELLLNQKVLQAKQEAAKAKLLEICETVLDEQEVENAINAFIQNTTNQLKSYGMSLEDYLQMSGATLDDLKNQNKIQAEEMVSLSGILEQISIEEKIEATQEEIKREIEGISRQYQMPVEQVEAMLRPEDKDNISKDIQLGKAFQFVIDNCVEI